MSSGRRDGGGGGGTWDAIFLLLLIFAFKSKTVAAFLNDTI